MSRARANWRRVALMRNKMHKVVVALRYVQSWQAPMVSLSCMVALVLLSYSPHIIVSLLLLFLACYGWLHHPPDAGAPLPMESDPEAEEDNEEVRDGGVHLRCICLLGTGRATLQPCLGGPAWLLLMLL